MTYTKFNPLMPELAFIDYIYCWVETVR